MRGEPEGVTMRPTIVTAPKVMHHHVKGIEFALKIEQVFGKHELAFLEKVLKNLVQLNAALIVGE